MNLNLASSVFWLVDGLALFLFATGVAALGALLKGCYVLRHLARGASRDDSAVLLKSRLVPAVSVVAVGVDAGFVRRLLGLQYGEHEVVLVLDGPSQAEMAAWTEEFHLAPAPPTSAGAVYRSLDPLRLTVIEKPRGGYAAAFNAGVQAAASPVIALFDPRSEFAPNALLRLIRPMLEDPENTAAVCGVAPGPPGKGWAGRYSALESLRLWLARGAAYAGWKRLLPVPGCALLVRRQSILKLGGFKGGPLDLVLQLDPKSVAFAPGVVSHLRPANSIAELREFVRRDQGEFGRVFRRRGVRVGLGLITMRLLRPLAEILAYLLTIVGLALGWVPLGLAALILVSTVGTGILVSMAAVVMRELAQTRGADPTQLTRLFVAAIPENLGYRQLRNLWLIGSFFGR